MSIARHHATRAFSLLECLVYIAVLALVMELAFAAYFRLATHHRRLAHNAEDIVRALQAGERWREDVRSAAGDLRLTGTGVAQELCIPRQDGEVAYAFRQGTVWRRDGAGAPWREFLPAVSGSRMLADPRTRVTAWRWELELQSTQRVVRVPPQFTFLAAAPKAGNP